MTKTNTEFLSYVEEVHQLWIPSKNPMSWTLELAQELYNAKFLIDTVLLERSGTNENAGQPMVEWHGTCYDVDGNPYRFLAKWILNPKKFTASEIHYYELDDLYVRPEETIDMGKIITLTEEQMLA